MNLSSWKRNLFCEEWWLAAATGGDYIDIPSNELSAGFLPIRIETKFGLKMISNPVLCPYLCFPLAGSVTTSSFHSRCREFLEALPAFDSLALLFSHRLPNVMPFLLAGCRAEPRCTYVIRKGSSEDQLWKRMAKRTKYDIRKGQDLYAVRDDLGYDPLFEFLQKTLDRKGLVSCISKERLASVFHESRKRSRGVVLNSVASDGSIHASAFFVWDDEELFYLMGGRNRELNSSFSQSLLIWEGIRLAQALNKDFNFEGSLLPGVEFFFRGFGGEVQHCFSISMLRSRKAKVIKNLREMLKNSVY